MHDGGIDRHIGLHVRERLDASQYVTRPRLARAALFQVLLPPNGSRESPMRVEVFYEHAPKLAMQSTRREGSNAGAPSLRYVAERRDRRRVEAGPRRTAPAQPTAPEIKTTSALRDEHTRHPHER